MTDRTLRGRAAIVGIGETPYLKHGLAPVPEFRLALQAILNACADAGVHPHDIDGFASYSNDRCDPSRLAAALGCRRLRSTTMQWGGGGGGCAAAVGNAAAAVAAGLADCVVVFRALAQGRHGRFGQARPDATAGAEMAWMAPYGVQSPAQKYAFKVQRWMHEHGVKQDALRAVSLASYQHAQRNPRAVMHGKPLDAAKYDASRWIVEPFHLFDLCQENDGAAAVIVVAAERARDFKPAPAYLLAMASGSDHRSFANPVNAPRYASASFVGVAQDLYRMARLAPGDIASVQAYENFTGGVVMALAEHGFFKPEEANDFMQLENLIAPGGRLPLNTSGGNLAEGYIHGFGLVLEAARQIRGSSTAQAARRDTALVIGGPLISPVSSLILGSEATL